MQRRGGGGSKWVCPTCICSVRRVRCKWVCPMQCKGGGGSKWVCLTCICSVKRGGCKWVCPMQCKRMRYDHVGVPCWLLCMV